jgi:2-amino-4-hydroxy-6-hydroxymethyldihydropteridine diphosphokinase
LGDRLGNLRRAITRLKESDEIEVEEISPVYETEPVGGQDQGWFLNLALRIQTSLQPLALLERLLSVEDGMGRTREKEGDARSIDLDLLFYDDRMVDSERLTIPHPRMHERKFVLVPLAQIAPELLHPRLQKSVEELLTLCRDKSEVRSYPGKL